MTLATSSIEMASLSRSRPRIAWTLGVVGCVVAAHWYASTLPPDQPSPWVLASHLFALVLLGGLLWIGGALGVRILRLVGLGRELGLETMLFALGLGLGGVAYLVLAWGFLGLLYLWALALLLAILAVALRAELAELVAAVPTWGRAWAAERRRLRTEPILGLVLPLSVVIVVMLTLLALAPPTGYDAMLYHLAGPREFLELGRFVAWPELQQANMPFTVEMLFLLGLAFGSDELSNVLHLTFAVLTALAAYSLGKRTYGPRVGLFAGSIVLSSPSLGFYAPIANIDYGWAYFDFLAVYAFLVWMQDRAERWLVLAGLAGGLSLGSKYLGVLTCAGIGLGIVVEVTRSGRRDLVRLVRLAALFAVRAALVAGPWYVKNWLWLGSPVWPFLRPEGGTELGDYFFSQMNRGRTPIDLLLLPLKLYQGDLMELRGAMPPLLLLLAPLYLLVRKRRWLTYLVGLSALHFAVWSQGIQTVRYLFPIFPAMSLVVAYALDRLIDGARWRRLARVAVPSLVLLSMALGSFAAVIMLKIQMPFAQLVGLESRQAYLSRNVSDYGAVLHLNEQADAVTRVLVIGDARVYYLTPPVVVDQGLDLFRRLAEASDPQLALDALRQSGVSHVLVGVGQISWLTRFDPEDRVKGWWAAFQRSRLGYLILEYETDVVSVYRVADAVAPANRR